MKTIKRFIYENVEYNIQGFKDEHIFKQINDKGFYEKGLLEYIKNLNIYGVYIDVGANIGNHSLFFANHCNSKKVISFEPEVECFELLKYNTNTNSKKEILINNLGVWNTKEKLFIKKFPNYKNMGLSTIVDKKTDNTYEINLISLDEFVCLEEKIGLIKIDVEGCELNILNGSKKIIEKYHPVIICEAEKEENKNKLDDLLSQYGYKNSLVKFNATPTYVWKI
jgi:FkbM family methyltransferase